MNKSLIHTHLTNLEKVFPSIKSSALFYADGVALASTMEDEEKLDEWASVACAMHTISKKSSELALGREVQCSVVKTDREVFVFSSLADELILLVIGAKNINTSVLVPELKRMAQAILNQLG